MLNVPALSRISEHEGRNERNPGAFAACAVSSKLLRPNFAAFMTPANEAETGALQAIEGLNARGIWFT